MMQYNAFCLLVIIFGGFVTSNFSYADNRQDLQTIRQTIQQQEQKLAEQKQQRSKLISVLEKQETSIANLLTSLEKSEKVLLSLGNEIAKLNVDIGKLKQKQAKQQQILAKQLESAFKLGKTSNMELIFSANESQRNERIITYYGYINQERQDRMNELKQIHDELNQKKSSLEEKQKQQNDLKNKQKLKRDALITNQKDRHETILELDKSMQLNQLKLAVLRENEAKLQAQITKAEAENKRIAEDEAKQAAKIRAKQQDYNYNPTKDERSLMARVSGIGKPNHRFNWPVTGTLLHRFGEPQQGELKWKGLVIKAMEGSKVRAIADGRVILANWLQGYGFIVALEHGKGDMTLYGYNQRVLVNVGDKIESGQEIALVGTSGGQGSAALYFEVRRDGKALDPSVWLKK
ncbi:murein hydrolase activator EnvC [Frischella sp. Ac48]|uniref:murein hydrolase activator EnvC n=1 Tax=Frischella sp. Ac48 TaxID=2804531 RepID=UPI001C7DE618|nr:murein hydrolase activator EnvC [Frischella sp. Ac48]MBX4132806.1 murein hydrolase activator EnvC [Frischella sp. Ac48]